MQQPVYKIGEVADMLTTSIRTVRYYEEASLVIPLRTPGGTRLYTRSHVDRLEAALRLARSGFSIESIAAVCHAREQSSTGDEGSRKVAELLDRTQSELDQQIRNLQALKKEIRLARLTIEECRGCSNVPDSSGCPDCPVGRKRSAIWFLNLVWDQDQP